MKPEKCKERIYPERAWKSVQCSRKAVKDGYCRQHHPDAVKARLEKSNARWEENRKKSSWYQLIEAQKRIAELTKENAELKEKLEEGNQ